MSNEPAVIDPEQLTNVSGGQVLARPAPAARPGAALTSVQRAPTPFRAEPMSLLGPKAEGTVAPVGRTHPNAFRSYGPDGAFSYFRVIDGKVLPGLI